jgi:lipoprotein-anchoring transpeptidase ErfK/SrfK
VGVRSTPKAAVIAVAAIGLIMPGWLTGVAGAEVSPSDSGVGAPATVAVAEEPTESDPVEPGPVEPEPVPEPPKPVQPEPVPVPPKPTKPETRAVVFSIDGQTVRRPTRVAPGSVVRITGVNPSSTVEIVHVRDPRTTFDVRQTGKKRVYLSEPLPPSTPVRVIVRGSDGSSAAVRVTTIAAPNTFSMTVTPSSTSGVMGAGIPLRVTFNRAITNRAAVERALVVESTKKLGAASWHWVSSTQVVFRPKNFWPGNTRVTLNADLRAVEGSPGWWGPRVTSTFRIGDQVILRTNFRTRVMTYVRNGVAERTFPISGGKSGWETRDGIKLITTHEKQRRLINPDPVNGWNVLTNYAMRLTQSGEFIHDATWNRSIGRLNNSHGCTNMTVPDVRWVFYNTRYGDIVTSSGSGVRVNKGEFLAGYWNYSWAEWTAGSALRTRR